MAILIPLAVIAVALAVFVRWLEPRIAFFPFPGEAETPRDFGVPFEAVTSTRPTASGCAPGG